MRARRRREKRPPLVRRACADRVPGGHPALRVAGGDRLDAAHPRHVRPAVGGRAPGQGASVRPLYLAAIPAQRPAPLPGLGFPCRLPGPPPRPVSRVSPSRSRPPPPRPLTFPPAPCPPPTLTSAP